MRILRSKFFFLVLTISFLLIGTAILVRYGQGYRLNLNKNNIVLSPTGLLALTSSPEGASVYIDDHLTAATNTSINLAPGDYTVKIVKEGYLPWEKKLKLQKEIATQANALLIPSAPRLESITSLGVLNPVVDPTGTKLAFGVASASASRRNGIFILDMNNRSILSLSSSSTQIADDTLDTLSLSNLEWSPSGTQILATQPNSKSTYLLSSSSFNQTPQDVTATLFLTRSQWERDRTEKEKARLASLKPDLADFISRNFTIVAWSPDDTKILYQASASATVNQFIDPPLIGANTQPEARKIEKGKIYVYDSKEDKNFYIKDYDQNLPYPVWFPDGKHLVLIEENQIKIMEYDGTNKNTVYAGPFNANFVYPWPDGSRLVILTSLNPQAGTTPNLYTISLK